MDGMKSIDGFYEDDEPVEKIIGAFDRGTKALTEAPPRGQTEYLVLCGPLLTDTPNMATAEAYAAPARSIK